MTLLRLKKIPPSSANPRAPPAMSALAASTSGAAFGLGKASIAIEPSSRTRSLLGNGASKKFARSKCMLTVGPEGADAEEHEQARTRRTRRSLKAREEYTLAQLCRSLRK
jgi:hypothetical protein